MQHARYKEMVSNIITLRYDIYISKINSMRYNEIYCMIKTMRRPGDILLDTKRVY